MLALCAASGAAALAHYVIDVVGDFALRHDAYDDIAHSSRELFSGIALLIAVLLAWRGLRICCDLAATYRGRLRSKTFDWREGALFGLVTGAATTLLVPLMECLDGRIAGAPISSLGDAFGGSVALGAGIAILCAATAGFLIYALARWLVSHRDTIATIIATLLRRSSNEPKLFDKSSERHSLTPRRRRTPHALRLCKRGPPCSGRHQCYYTRTSFKGDSREFLVCSRVARARRARGRVRFRGARHGGARDSASTHGTPR